MGLSLGPPPLPLEHLYWEMRHPTLLFYVYKALSSLAKESLRGAGVVSEEVPL